MDKPESRRLAETVGSTANMTLFLIFAVCCLLMVSVAASAYGRINENYHSTFSSTAAVRYITNKLRACDTAEVLSDSSILLRNQGYSTLIYESGGVIRERLFPEESEIKVEGGEELFTESELEISAEKGLIHISVADADGGFFETHCRYSDGGDGNA